jgi:hypothetical protein
MICLLFEYLAPSQSTDGLVHLVIVGPLELAGSPHDIPALSARGLCRMYCTVGMAHGRLGSEGPPVPKLFGPTYVV